MRRQISFHISWLLWAALLFFPYSEAKHLFNDQFKKPLECVTEVSSCAHTTSPSLPNTVRSPGIFPIQLHMGWNWKDLDSVGNLEAPLFRMPFKTNPELSNRQPRGPPVRG